MAKSKVPCFLCGKTDHDPSWPEAKYCPHCDISLCSKCGSSLVAGYQKRSGDSRGIRHG